MRIKSIVQTCGACPSQWEGHLEDGRMFYARYRYGVLRIELSNGATDNVFATMEGQVVYHEALGDGMDGVMTGDELLDKMRECGFTF